MSNLAVQAAFGSTYAADDSSTNDSLRYTGSSNSAAAVVEPAHRVQRNKFVGRSHQVSSAVKSSSPWQGVPPDVRHWIEILEIDIKDCNAIKIHTAWRKLMASPAVHPDLGGDTELAVLVTRAKDELLHWVELQSPKLGKQFAHLAK